MSKPPPATFEGYVTEAGGKIVQSWFDSLPIEEYEALQDRFNTLSSTPITEWKRPQVDKVHPPLVEVRAKANRANHEIRVYGAFDDKVRGRFILLNGNEAKQKSYDKDGQDLALKRLSLLKAGKASTHEFAFEKGASGTGEAQPGKPIAFSGFKPGKWDRLPDPFHTKRP